VLIGAFALRPPSAVWTNVRDTWWPGMQASIKFWPVVHLVTFSPLIPLELKLLWIDGMEIIWISILSRVNARENEAGSAGPS
jgi:protein Mpv17